MRRFFRILKRILFVLLGLALLLAVAAFFYMRQPQFGQTPSGARLAAIQRSPNYRGGKFRNKIEKPTLTEGYSIWGEAYKILFKKNPRTEPIDPIPSINTDLKAFAPDANVLVWFGHSSALMQVDGKTILIDPIFSEHASPLPWGVGAYKGSNIYNAADLPEIDYLLISHDHYDHLDYETIRALKDKVKHVVCGLGTGAHFDAWGYPAGKIIEKDWNGEVAIEPGIIIHTLPSHHESGRGFITSQSLWMSFLVETPSMKIYYSGDGGYDDRFKEIGKRFGPIDLAIMENGQYDKAWQSVHELPEEVMQATQELKARRLLTVHHSKFTLGKHAWDEPLTRISALAKGTGIPLLTPMIGETVFLKDTGQVFKAWWLGVR